MTTPRDPYDRDPYDDPYDPYDRSAGREPDEPDGTATWGRPPAGGWGDPGRADGGRGGQYGGETPGPYGSEPEYGWRQPEYEPAGGVGGGYATPEYGPSDQQGRYEPSWEHGRPAAPPRRAARRPRRPPWIVLAVAGAVVVAVLVLGFVTPGWFVTRVFDAAAVQTGVARILTDEYGAEGVADVRCPGGIQVTAGATFTCDATIDADLVTVPVRVTDGDGGYEVGRPT